MKKSLVLALSIGVLSSTFAVSSYAGVWPNAMTTNGVHMNSINGNGQKLNGSHSGQALQGLALSKVKISFKE